MPPDGGSSRSARALHAGSHRSAGGNACRPCDDEWLRDAAPKVVKAADWIVRQREAAPKNGLTRGMIKFRPYCDYPEAVYNYIGDSYCCVGLDAAANELGAIGMSDEAKRYADEAARYRKDLIASMKAAAFKHDGQTILPIEPETHRLLNDSKMRGGDYYGLTAGILLEIGVLDPDSRQAALLVDLMEKRNGLILGSAYDRGAESSFCSSKRLYDYRSEEGDILELIHAAFGG